MPLSGKDANAKHSVVIDTNNVKKIKKNPGVQLALKCPKSRPCQMSVSDSDGSTEYGSITNLLSHDVSPWIVILSTIIRYEIFRDSWDIHTNVTLVKYLNIIIYRLPLYIFILLQWEIRHTTKVRT